MSCGILIESSCQEYGLIPGIQICHITSDTVTACTATMLPQCPSAASAWTLPIYIADQTLTKLELNHCLGPLRVIICTPPASNWHMRIVRTSSAFASRLETEARLLSLTHRGLIPLLSF